MAKTRAAVVAVVLVARVVPVAAVLVVPVALAVLVVPAVVAVLVVQVGPAVVADAQLPRHSKNLPISDFKKGGTVKHSISYTPRS